MKALILAAGMGTRLSPITDSKPKSLVEVNGKSILFKQIDNLLENGIDDIHVVAGYRSDVLIESLLNKYGNTVHVIINDVYDKTNNMYSAYKAREIFIGSRFILMNADVFFDSSVLTELLKEDYNNSIVVEEGSYNEENMKVTCCNGRLERISKSVSKEESFGVSIDVYKFSEDGSKVFFEAIFNYIENKKELNHWTEVALDDALKISEFTSCPLKGRWMEIDNHEDLKKAESIFYDER